jgi:hypothetical protein
LHNLLLQTFEAKRGQSNPPNVYSNRKRLLILAPHFPSRGPTLDLFTALSSPGSREALLPSNFGRLAKSIEAENIERGIWYLARIWQSKSTLYNCCTAKQSHCSLTLLAILDSSK